MADGVRLVEQAFHQYNAGESVVLPRLSVSLAGDGGVFRVMCAVLPQDGFYGLKTLTGYPGRRAPGEAYFAILLFSAGNGALRAIVSADRLTGIRTGAASGVAAKYLSRPDARVLGIIGAGVQARYQVAGLQAVRPLTEARVYDLDTAKASAFAREIERDLGLAARAVSSAREAIAGSDLVVTVTAAKTPVFDGGWLEHGCHVSGVGSNTPGKRELDGEVFRRSKVVVDFREQALQEAGDLQEALKSGAIREQDIHADLGQVVSQAAPGRESDNEITLFKSVGTAIEDIATAAFAYQQALAAGVGTVIDLDGANGSATSAAVARVAVPGRRTAAIDTSGPIGVRAVTSDLP
jgi:ornithine cyclodeaminase/alanine dehydrogenase